MRWTAVASWLLALGLTGCGQATSASPGGSGGFQPGDVTPVVLQLDSGPVELAPWTYCLGNGCADGAPPDRLHDAGDPAEVPFTFDRSGWEFSATFRERVPECARMITAPVEKTADRAFVVRPAGPAGDWDVDVSGHGDGGDVITSFRWHTPVDGQLPEPASGSVAVLADHDGELDSYGVELYLSDLDRQPREATARITVTGADGRSISITPRRDDGCYSAGDVGWRAPRSEGLAATTIGEGPFTYSVEVTLDGRRYVGHGTWPGGEAEDFGPHVPLTWEPALPSYTG
jgi:hypothetical protein